MKLRVVLTLLASFFLCPAQTITTLASFTETEGNPTAFFQGSDGNFYLVTEPTSVTGPSMVVKLTPDGALTTVYAGTNSTYINSLMQASDGNFYGTAIGPIAGAGSALGAIFKLTPSGTLTVLHAFSGPDGAYSTSFNPPGPLVEGTDGNLYGSTPEGGASYTAKSSGLGTIFRVNPTGTFSTLYSFSRPSDGAQPGALTLGSDGNLYGTTSYGGSGACPFNGTFPAGCGTIFQITTLGSFSTLYNFEIQNAPPNQLIAGSDGNLYGNTPSGECGSSGCGFFYKITPHGSLTTILTFGPNMFAPNNGITLDFLSRAGNFYGIAFGNLSIAKISPTGVESVVYTFCPASTFSFCSEGENPTLLIQGSDGSLYGTTSSGGAKLYGAVYRLTLPSTDLPSIATSQPVNGASFLPGIVPGSWITVQGNNLSTVNDQWAIPPSGALPTSLGGVTLTVGGKPAYIAYITPTQINAIAPDVPSGNAAITVMNSNGTSSAVTAEVQSVQPAFFLWGTYAVATHQDFSIAVKNGVFGTVPTTPAKPGETIILWGTGFGPTSPSAPVGIVTPSDQTYYTANTVSVTVGTMTATVYGAALAPGFAGLYQIAVQIPASLTSGDYPVVASVAGSQSPSTALITVLQ